MSLNVIDSNNFIKTNRSDNVACKFPLITLLNKKNFKLRSKNKGKLLNKPVYSGFKKNTLSSIPRDVEIILLDKNKEELFSTSSKNILGELDTNSYSNNINTKNKYKTKNANTGITSYISKIIKDKNINSSLSNITKTASKKDKSIIVQQKNHKKNNINTNIPKDKKNFSLELYQSQFMPGPSDYSIEKSFDMLNQQNKYRYSSLFKTGSNINKKVVKNTSPGPGSYIQIKDLTNNDDKHLKIDLARKEKRFKNLFSSASLSPWYYSSTNDDIKFNNKVINNNINQYNKRDVYDFQKYLLKKEIDDKGIIRKFYIEEIPQSKIQETKEDKQDKISDKINKKENENQKINEYKFDNLLKKYIQVRNSEKEYEVPGPGKYNIYMGFDKILKDKEIERLQNPHKPENLIPEEVLKKYIEVKNNPNLTLIFRRNTHNKNISKQILAKSKSCENIIQKKEKKKNSSGGTLPFISKQKRIKYHDDILSHHVPGPCYYYNDSPSEYI